MSTWNERTSLIVMKRDPGGNLVPATESEVHEGVDAWQADRVTRRFGVGPGREGRPMSDIHTPAQARAAHQAEAGRLGQPVITSTMQQAAAVAAPQTCPPNYGNTQGYMSPAVTGSCRLEKGGIGEVGLHTNAAGGLAATATTVQLQRAATINRIAAYAGGGLDNWALSHFDVDQDQFIHATGRLVPASVFSPKAAFPVAFNLGMGTSDNLRIDSQQLTVTAARWNSQLAVAGTNKFVGAGYPAGAFWPVPAMGRRSRQIILGLNNVAGGTVLAQGAVPASTNTIANNPAVPIRAGALILSAVWGLIPDSGATIGGVKGQNGQTPDTGINALSYVVVDDINVNGVTNFTQRADTAGVFQNIPGMDFHAESNLLWAPNSVLTPSDQLNVVVRSVAPAAVTAGTNNQINIIAAVIGCERLAVC